MTNANQTLQIAGTYTRFSDTLLDLVEAVINGADSHNSAAKVAVLARQVEMASQAMWEALSIAHADTLGLDPDQTVRGPFGSHRPDAPSENCEDFASWSKSRAVERSHGPIVTLQAAE